MLNLSDLSRIKGFRFPRAVIGYAVWAYHRFALSLRDVEDMLAARGVSVSYETVRDWVARFGGQFAALIRRERSGPADKWHLDEVLISIKGKKYWLWRAVDANGDVLDILIQSRRNTSAAKRFFRKLFRRWGQPRVGHGQARFLRCGQNRDRPRDRTSPAQGVEQSGRSLTPAHPSTREDHGALQVPGSGTTVPLSPGSDRHLVPPETPSPLRPIIPS